MENKTTPSILPAGFASPGALLITHHAPLFLLLILNSLFCWILSSEFDTEQTFRWGALLAGNAGLLAGSEVLRRLFTRTGNPLPLIFSACSLAANIVYLVFITIWHRDLIPTAEALWILSPMRWMGLQYTLIMPALFHSALRLACFPTRLPRKADLAATWAGAILIPFTVYLFMTLIMDHLHIFEGLLITFLATSTLISLILILRGLASIYMYASRSKGGQILICVLFALVAPLCGLWLNQSIPFPADYQMPWVYGLTTLNALILLLPVKNQNKTIAVIVWFSSCALFPFTLYFFLVFLPWLPLSLLAMIALGAGFLILAPTGLMLIHCLKLRGRFSALSTSVSKSKLFVIALIGFSIIPAGYTVRALHHRQILGDALTYAYEPDYTQKTPFTQNSAGLKNALTNLQKHYEGRYVPYLSDLYDALVFNGMILPESKLREMVEVFTGEPLPELEQSFDLWGTSRRSRRSFRINLATPPPTFSSVKQIEWDVHTTGSVCKVQATLTLENPLNRESEFVQTIPLPPGAWVTDYWLDVEGEKKHGRITEKKTALWVYRMIRDATRRDPGILVYNSPEELELRVFPFSSNQIRKTGIEFTLPANNPAPLTIAGSKAPLPIPDESFEPVRATSEQGGYIGLPPKAITLPSVTRNPSLYIMMDQSLLSEDTASRHLKDALEALPDSIRNASPKVNLFSLGINVQPLHDEVLTLSEAETMHLLEMNPPNTGILLDRGLSGVLNHYRQTVTDDPVQASQTYPLPILIRGEKDPVEFTSGWSLWAEEIPEWSDPAVWHQGQWEDPPTTNQTPVHLVKAGENIRAIDASALWVDWWIEEPGTLSIQTPDGDWRPVEPLSEAPALSRITKAVHNYRNYQLRGPEHTSLREVVSSAREANVLVPSTALIVLENQAQEKMMKLKEQQKLSGPDAVDFMDAPEPQALFIIGTALLLALYHLRQKSKTNVYV